MKRTQFRMQVVQKRWLHPFTIAVSTKGTSFRHMGQDQSLLPSPAPDSLSRQAVSSSLTASSPSPPSSSVRKESSSALRSSALASILISISFLFTRSTNTTNNNRAATAGVTLVLQPDRLFHRPAGETERLQAAAR